MDMTITTFEDILAWQKAKILTVAIYKQFKDSRNFGYKGQIERASVSIMNNIAEGYERKSNKEFKQFLFIAKGSCGEVRSMLRVAEDLGYITPTKNIELIQLASEISKMLSGLIKKL